MKSFRSISRYFSKANSIARISPIAAAALLALSPTAFGAADNWTNASGGSWTDSTWSLGSAPGFSNDAVFNLGSTSGYTVTLPSNQSLQSIDVDTDTLTLNLNGFGLTGGFDTTTSGFLNVGAASGQNASLTVTSPVATSIFSPDQQAVIGGNGGTGSITIDHATVLANEGFPGDGFSVGVGLNSVGTLIAKDGAQIDTGIHGSGPGPFGSFLVGDMGSGGSGSASLNNSGAGAGVVADIGGNASLTLTNQSTFGGGQGGAFFVFGTAAGRGLVSLDNSSLKTLGGLAALTVANGGTLSATDGAQVEGGQGLVVGGSNAFNVMQNSAVGTAQLTVSGAGTRVEGDSLLDVGDNGSTGTCTVSAGGSLGSSAHLYVGGNGGTGMIQVSGSGTSLGTAAAPTAVAVIGANSTGQAGTGTIQIDTNATWTIPGTVTLDAGGTLNVLSGANLIVKNLDLSHGGTTNFTGGTITLTGGTLTASSFSLPNTSTLAGAGTFTGNLTSSGSVSPGDAPGILKVSGNYIQNANGALDIGLGGTTAGTQYDQLQITGSASLAGTLDVTLLGGFSPAIGNSFDLFTDASESGTFSTFELPSLPAGSWDTSNLYTTGVITVVSGPQPITVASGQTYHFTASTGTGILVTTVAGLTVHATGSAIVDPAANHANRQLLVVTGSGLALDGSSPGNWTGLLDMGNNDLDLPGASLTTVADQIRQGSAGGAWNGTGGITSSSAAADTKHLTALGVIQNNQGGAPLYTTFDGQTVGASDVLVKFTYYGDALLTGSVTAGDYIQIDNGFDSQTGPNPLTGWFNGDFNYDGVINGDDFTLIDNAFNGQGSVSLAGDSAGPAEMITSDTEQLSIAVPEPIMTMPLIALGLICRRRRPASPPQPKLPA